jgi:hypothetical protein
MPSHCRHHENDDRVRERKSDTRCTHIRGQGQSTPRGTPLYTWQDKGVKQVSTWSKAVRKTMLKGDWEELNSRGRKCSTELKDFLRTTDKGVARIRQVACTGVKCDLMDSKRWGWECMLQLQEAEDRKPPAATTWAAEFLLRVGESKECLGFMIIGKFDFQIFRIFHPRFPHSRLHLKCSFINMSNMSMQLMSVHHHQLLISQCEKRCHRTLALSQVAPPVLSDPSPTCGDENITNKP